MNLDSLAQQWQQHNHVVNERLDATQRWSRALWFETHRERLSRFSPGSAISAFTTLVVLGSLLWFMATNATHLGLASCAATVLVWTLAAVACQRRARTALQNIDYRLPVVQMQIQLEKERLRRLEDFQWLFITGQIVWVVPFVAIIVRMTTHVDLFAVGPDLRWAIGTAVVASVGIAPLLLVMSRFAIARVGRVGWLSRLADAISGQDLQLTRARIVEFERIEHGASN